MVTELQRTYEFQLETVYKPSLMMPGASLLPKFPALKIDRELIFEDRITTVEELEGELLRRGAQRRTGAA